MTYSIKNKAKDTSKTVSTIFKNVTEEVLAVSLVIVAGHSAYSAKAEDNVTWLTYVLAASAAIIAVYAAVQLVRHFNK